VYVRNGAKVERITIEGDNVVVQGQGRVDAVTVESGGGVEVTVTGAKITNNGASPVKTGGGEIAPGTSGTGSAPATGGGGGGGGGDVNSTPSALTLEELRAALEDSAIIEVNVPVRLVNSAADLTIPAGKTVVLAPGAGLSLNKLTVDGTLIGDSGTVVFTVTSLNGAGLNPGGENGFFGMNAAYRPVYLAWYDKGAGVTTTGWWPTSVEVNTESALTDALAVPTVIQVSLVGNFTVNGDHAVNSLYISGNATNITIASGATVTANTVIMGGPGNSYLTVDGTLAHTGSEPVIRLYRDNTVTLNGRIIPGPNSKYFDRNIVRIIPWTDSAWGTPYLYNTDTGERSAQPTATSTGELEYLAKTYPELTAIHLYGAFDELDVAAFSSFSDDYMIEAVVPVSIHGNQTFGFGADADTRGPVVIGAGKTLTVESGAEVEFVSDDRTKNATVGADNTSKIVVQPEAEVYSYYADSEFPDNWEAGTYVWNGDAWVKQ
jgi:hypothetical protein